MPRILVACDKFKGSLTAPEACTAVANGIRRVLPSATIDCCPIADGGEGFVDAIITAVHGRVVTCNTCDAIGRPVSAKYGLTQGEHGITAVMEMAEAAGLWRLKESERDILRANTLGVGLLLLDAVRTHGATRLILGIGGSGTNDGGAGLAHALGIRFRDANGTELPPCPSGLSRLRAVDRSGQIPLPPLTVACDVSNPLLGPRGATRIFGPQKGATPGNTPVLENALRNLVLASDGQYDADAPGAGAAGGLGFGLLHFLNADLRPGFDIVARTVNLAARIAASDIIVTGEGSLDAQSLAGKGPAGVALQGLLAAKPVVALVGRTDTEVRMSGLFHHIGAVLERGHSITDCIANGAAYLEEEATYVPWTDMLHF
jgi:glycerate kinase